MPGRYFPRAGAARWIAVQKDMLERLHADGVSWPEIAQRCGHPKSSCQTMLSQIRRERKLTDLAAAPPRFMPAAPEPALPPTGRHRRMSTLLIDAELRARIEIMGPNGLLGDPLPGRSALDQKKLQPGAGGHLAPSASASGATPASDADAFSSEGAR